jgi:type I restriction enzyme S subunit
MRSNYKPLGNYIREINIRNTDLLVSKLVGVSMEKKFISSVANLVDTDMSVYKILKKGQFACKLMSVGRDEQLPVDLYKDDEDAIVSSAYYVFEPIDTKIILPEYLFMWLCRSENDRYIGYISGGDVRGGISWDTFCEIPINVPHIDKQREIVKEYNVLVDRINLNNQLIQKLEETARVIYRRWFVDFEFPDENGKPYKSNGGEIEFNEELEKDIPKGWEIKCISKLTDCVLGGTPSRDKNEYWNGNINWINSGEVNKIRITKPSEKITEIGLKKSATKIMPIKTTVLAITGATLGQVSILEIDTCANQSVIGILENNNFPYEYIFPAITDSIKELLRSQTGGAQPHINKNDVETLKVIFPIKNQDILKDYKKVIKPIYDQIAKKCFELDLLSDLQNLLLSKLAITSN